jgi:hypothetical protein
MKQFKLFLASLVIFFTTANLTTFAQPNLGVYPTILEYHLANGQSESKAIHLTNNSPDTVQFRLYINDWYRDTMGGHAYFRADTLPQSCAKWMTTDKNFIQLETGKSTDVTVKLSLPDDGSATDKMRWAMLFIETVEEKKNIKEKGTQAAVRNVLRIGVHVYQTPPTITEKSIKVIDLTPVPKTTNTYQLLCQNTGKVMVDCKSYLVLNSMADGKETKLEPVEFPMFPEQRRYVVFELPKDFPKGKYSVQGVLDGGEDISLEAVENVIDVK